MVAKAACVSNCARAVVVESESTQENKSKENIWDQLVFEPRPSEYQSDALPLSHRAPDRGSAHVEALFANLIIPITTKVLNLWSPLQMGLRVWVG